jgi:nucleoside phosphorylase
MPFAGAHREFHDFTGFRSDGTDSDIVLSMSRSDYLVILCAMQGEANAIIERLSLSPADTPWPASLPPRMWSGEVEGERVVLVTNGHDSKSGADLIGTTPATLATSLIVEKLDPRMILIAGAAGGCSEATRVGHVYLIERAFHHDRRIPLPEFEEYAHGPEHLHANPHLAEAFDAQIATISTGNALDTLDWELSFFRENGITVKDMETASIAWTANLSAVPVMALRSITDHYDHPAPESQFLSNFEHALRNLADSVANGLNHLLHEHRI